MLNNEEIKSLESRILKGEIKSLEQVFKLTDSNYSDLHERLNISKYKLTKLKNDHTKDIDIPLLKKLSKLTKVKASVLLIGLEVGVHSITVYQKNMLLEEGA